MSLAPIIYSDGSAFYEELGKKYIQHDKGLFILAPSGVGKTHFCSAQKELHWIDGDELWLAAGAHPPLGVEWWNQGVPTIEMVEQRSDVVTADATAEGVWIMGSSCFALKPDAIVVPDWDVHVGQIKHREENNYDGGMKSHQLDQVKIHIDIIRRWKEQGVPEFQSIQEAVDRLTGDVALAQ
jgi:hypothetical protein